jgi:putative ABC transport system permease protein
MKAVPFVARAELRSRLLSVLALAILLGLSSGAVMTLAAGARRTDSAYERFAREQKAADMLIYPAFEPETFANIPLDTIAALPQVAASGRGYFLASTDEDLAAIAPGTGMGKTVDVPKLIEGRLPKADSVEETAVSFTLAKSRHLHVGGSIKVNFAPETGPPAVPRTLRIVGIEASPGEFPPQLGGFGSPNGGILQISPALYESMRGKRIFHLEFLVLRLKRGAADFAAVNEELNKLAEGKPQLNQNLGAQAANVQRSIHLQAVALRIVAGLVALISLLVLSQLIARQASIDAAESPILSALGMTRRQVALTGLSRSAAVGLVGALVGVAVAAATSPLMPIGLARVAEPNTGFALDPFVIGLGVLATVAIVLGLAAWPLWRNSRALPEVVRSSKPSIVARSAAASGFSPAMSTGMSLALEAGRGRTAVPVRSSLTSVAVAIVGLASALTFGAGLNHLLSTPRQYGWNWDAHITTGDEQPDIDDALKVLDADPDVQDVAIVDTPPVTFAKTVQFDAIALGQHKGSLQPRVIDGHAPRTANEIAVGARTLREAHVHIGSTVPVSISAIEGGGADFTVVGTVVVPPNSDTTRLGSGGVVTREGELRMVPPEYTGVPPITDAYFTLAPGVDHRKALARIVERTKGKYDLQRPQQPRDLVNFGQVQNLPLLLAGLVALLAAATLAQTLVTSIRRRRRDLAILKMLGFVPGQVRWTIAWQATTFVSAALLIGLPIGVVAGRIVWTAFAHQLGTPPEPVTPSIQLLLTLPAAVLLANLVAAAPAVIAGRMKPAAALRAE